MGNLFRGLLKHIFIYFIIVKNCVISYLEYRANLFANLTMEIVFLISKLLYVAFFFNSGIKISGMSPDEIMMFIGTFVIMTGIYVGFFGMNFYAFPELIRTGAMDMYITKPVSLQFISTLRHFNFVVPIPNTIAGVIMVALAWRRLGIPVGFVNIAGYILIIASATVVTYSVFLLPQLLSFWTVKSQALTEIADKCWDFNNMPMNIYKKWMQRFGIFILPIFFVTNFPAMFVLGKLNAVYLIWAFAAPFVFVVISRLAWNVAIKNYTSASS